MTDGSLTRLAMLQACALQALHDFRAKPCMNRWREYTLAVLRRDQEEKAIVHDLISAYWPDE